MINSNKNFFTYLKEAALDENSSIYEYKKKLLYYLKWDCNKLISLADSPQNLKPVSLNIKVPINKRGPVPVNNPQNNAANDKEDVLDKSFIQSFEKFMTDLKSD